MALILPSHTAHPTAPPQGAGNPPSPPPLAAAPTRSTARAANDPAPRTQPGSPAATKAQALAYWSDSTSTAAHHRYHAHHFNCPLCIAAGRGSQYGERCAMGLDLLAMIDNVKALYAVELQKKMQQVRTIENPAPARPGGDSAAENATK